MKTRTIACALLMGACGSVNAQNWNTAGNLINTPLQYLGCNGTSTQPLRLTTIPNFPIEMRTTNIQRARLNASVTSSMGPGNPFPGVVRDGFLLLSGQPDAFTNVNSRAPFTRLHLIDDATGLLNPVVYAQEHGYRPWQRNGITFTGNSDQSYIGHKYDANDNTDFVIQWSDNPESSPWGTDRLKIVFTTQYSAGAGRGAATTDGLEAMRFWPESSTEVNVGIGDFAPPAIGDPTERVDILDGRLRIRDLPEPSGEATGTYRIMVVDDSAIPSGERGVVKWVDPAEFVDADCDWQQVNDGVSNPALSHHVYTAVGNSDACPDASDAVGVGIDLSTTPAPGKFGVWSSNFVNTMDVAQIATTPSGNGMNLLVSGPTTTTRGINITAQQGASANADNRGLSVQANGTGSTSNDYNFGVFASATGPANRSRGVHGDSNGATYYGLGGEFISNDNATYTTGAQGHVTGGQLMAEGIRGTSVSNASTNSGVFGWVYPTTATGTNYYGIYGRTSVSASGSQSSCGVYGEGLVPNSWAGCFAGNVNCTGTGYYVNGVFVASDESLKTNVEPLESPLQVIAQLQPKQYEFVQGLHSAISLPEGQQAGFLAQELEQVLPSLVRDARIPASSDSVGNVISESIDYKAVNYDGIVPYLVGAIQELNARNDALAAQMSDLQDALAACCANPDGSRMLDQGLNQPNDLDGSFNGSDKLRIQPNPFNERTTVFYTLDRGGRTQLLANSSDGRDLRVLQEADLEAGSYQYDWNTAALAPGMYYVTLLLDGQPVVKKAVKVDR